LAIESRGITQVSMNLTDYERTGLYKVYEAVRAEAQRLGVQILSSEVIGLVPAKALENAAAEFLKVEQFTADRILENRLTKAQSRVSPQ
jgi:glutamate formiminotransferase / 5-formyltetrahydrofolate cyclo-ligase